jgi:hypothetical protein
MFIITHMAISRSLLLLEAYAKAFVVSVIGGGYAYKEGACFKN